MPEVVELDPAEAEALADKADELAALGLVLEPFGPGAVAVRESPALLGETDVDRPGRATSPTTSPRGGHGAGAEGAAGGGLRDHGLPRLGPRRAAG